MTGLVVCLPGPSGMNLEELQRSFDALSAEHFSDVSAPVIGWHHRDVSSARSWLNTIPAAKISRNSHPGCSIRSHWLILTAANRQPCCLTAANR